jgi:hypothetical protein
MFNRDKKVQLEKYYALAMQSVIQTILTRYGDYFVSSSNYDTGGILTEPWKRHLTFIFKSAEVHEQAKRSGIWSQIEADTRAAIKAANAGIHDEKPIDLYWLGSADIDAINAAGGYYYYFK